ncbi:AGAP008775-PA [Anopheles gambiae str. PEST]|uniref:AGAP008775-PA n=1 Tax=Anopheles gambiae TaxID=7165 RepID=Q7Q865_ANOGA|nr:AGAP008775-PA [Anopheles gambiae str. PEST]
MAMYYYASKLSAVACGTRCRQGLARRQRTNRTNRQGGKKDDDEDSDDNSKDKKVIAISRTRYRLYTCNASGKGARKMDVLCIHRHNAAQTRWKLTNAITLRFRNEAALHSYFIPISIPVPDTQAQPAKWEAIGIVGKKTLQAPGQPRPPNVKTSMTDGPRSLQGSLGTGGVMYGNGTIVSGPLESLIDLLMPGNVEEFDQEYVFSFLLSARFFIRSFELLGKLLESIPEPEPLERIVPLLGVWTRMFPYDFRDERMMNHVKHIVARCADTKLANVVPQLLCALLARLTELENHEEELRSYQSTADNKVGRTPTESISWPTATQLAQLLCRIERKLAKHVGPEEFVQCSPNLLKDPNREDFTPKPISGAGGHATSLDGKKTCNLESYLEWSARLRLLVANEILKCRNIQDRNKQFELWSGAAQYCLLVGNYNSATAILESFDLPPVARLQVTVGELIMFSTEQ